MEKVDVTNKKTNREPNIELLRIVGMFMVITVHCINRGLLLNYSGINAVNTILIRFLDAFVLTANSIFLIISGYYLIDKKFNIKKILILWGKTIFYSLLIFIICNILGMETFAFDSILPIFSGQYWFISAYIALYFLIPIINIFLNKINQKQFKYLLIALVVMFGVVRILFNPSGIFGGAMFPVIMIYAIGAYIRKYVTIKPKQKYFLLYLLLTVIYTLIYSILCVISNSITDLRVLSKFNTVLVGVREYNSILVVGMTILLFMKFKTITIKSNFASKLIRIISLSVFSIYLIHENINIRNAIWLKTGILSYADSWLMVPYILLIVSVVFVVCLFIDLARRGIYFGMKKIPVLNRYIDKLNNSLDKVNLRINNYLSD